MRAPTLLYLRWYGGVGVFFVSAGMLKHIDDKFKTLFFWPAIIIAIAFSYIIGRGDGFESRRQTAIHFSKSDKLLDEIMDSWTPDRVVVSKAEVTAVPFTPRPGFFPDTVVHLAVMVQDSFQVPAEVTLAQWALESGYGRNGIGDHNYFGHHYIAVKGFMSHPAFTVAYDRTIVDGGTPWQHWKRIPVRYAKYRTMKECFMVHGEYLSTSGYYKSAFHRRTLRGFVHDLAEHYAEDPRYALKLDAIIERYNLSSIVGSIEEDKK